MRRSCGNDPLGLPGSPTIDSKHIAKLRDHHVLGDIQPDDPPEHTEPEQPKIESDAGDEAEHTRDSYLK